jgi:hypothetical protein
MTAPQPRSNLLAAVLAERFPTLAAVRHEAARPIPAPRNTLQPLDPMQLAHDVEQQALQSTTYRQSKAAERLAARVQAARRLTAVARRRAPQQKGN